MLRTPLAFALQARYWAASLPREIQDAPRPQARIIAYLFSATAELVLREWVRRRGTHVIEALVTEGELELVLRRLRWAFADLPFLVAFAGVRTLANAWCTSGRW